VAAFLADDMRGVWGHFGLHGWPDYGKVGLVNRA
jgi:hypothetical protein